MTRGLLVVTIDRMPAWMLPAWGSTWVSMPALDSLAARGVVFDRMIATTDDPYGVVGDLLGGWDRGAMSRAAARGWPVACVTDDAACATLASRSIRDVTLVPPHATDAVAASDGETSLGRLFAAAGRAVALPGPRLVWCHAASLGITWDAPRGFREAYADPEDPPPPEGAAVPQADVGDDADPDFLLGVRQAYAGQLTLLDRCLAAVVEAVRGASAGDATGWTILVAGVRGIALGLHGRVGIGPLPPYGEVTHIPAVLVDADGRMAAQRHGGLVIPADIGCTVADAVSAAPPDGGGPSEPWGGRSLSGLFVDWLAPGRDRVVVRAGPGGAIVTPAWMLVTPDAPSGERSAAGRLFAKPDDFFELCDVADRCPEVADELRRLLREVDGARSWTEPLSAAAARGG